MKNKIYILIIMLGILSYMYILFFIPKIETLTYEKYEANSKEPLVEDREPDEKNYSSIILIDNIQEFSRNYQGEVALLDVTNKLIENTNEKFKYIVEEYYKVGAKKLLVQEKNLLLGNFGIDNQNKLDKLITKLQPLSNQNITSIAIKEGTFIQNEKVSTVDVILNLEDNTKIELILSVLNYVKQTEEPIISIY